MDTSLYELEKHLPPYLRRRLVGMTEKTWSILYPRKIHEEVEFRYKKKNIKQGEYLRRKEIVNKASIYLFIKYLYKYFMEGTRVAIETVDFLKEQCELPGFKIGSKEFAGRNENVLQGQLLAESMLKHVQNKELRVMIVEGLSDDQIAYKVRKLIENEQKI